MWQNGSAYKTLKKKGYINFWKTVHCDDESKSDIFGYVGKQNMRRKPNTTMAIQNLLLVVKHGGGSVLIWGCMSTKGYENRDKD